MWPFSRRPSSGERIVVAFEGIPDAEGLTQRLAAVDPARPIDPTLAAELGRLDDRLLIRLLYALGYFDAVRSACDLALRETENQAQAGPDSAINKVALVTGLTTRGRRLDLA